MEIKRLLPEDITAEYIDTLNDAKYMQYSRNSQSIHTIDSQIEYVKSFDRETLDPQSLIFGVFLKEKLICTLTVYFDKAVSIANIGVLVFKTASSKGVAKYSLSVISRWLSARYPVYLIQVGTHKSNLPMIRTALSCGYFQISNDVSDYVFFQYQKSPSQNEALLFINKFIGPTLFFASDTGGAENLMEVFLRANLEKTLLVRGKGEQVFKHYGIKYLSEVSREYSDYQSLIFSSGADNSELAIVQEKSGNSGSNQVCVLDHWVNYSKRFSVKSFAIPETFIVTNEISHFLASKHFASSTIALIPDFRLKRLQDLMMVDFSRGENCVLVLLEPERAWLEGLGEITRDTQVNTIMQAMLICESMGLRSVVVRLHPAMRESGLIRDLVKSESVVRFSMYSRIEDELQAAKAVVGISSSLLYATASLGIPTFTTLEFTKNSWMGLFGKIKFLPRKQFL